jgi:hypothetical protein
VSVGSVFSHVDMNVWPWCVEILHGFDVVFCSCAIDLLREPGHALGASIYGLPLQQRGLIRLSPCTRTPSLRAIS